MCEAAQAGWASIAGALLSGGATAVSFTQPVHGGLAAMLGGSGSGSNPSAVMVVDERAATATAVFFVDGCEIARQAVAGDDTMAARTVRAAVTCAGAASTVVAAEGGHALQWILGLTAAATPAADDLRLAAGDSGAFDWPPSQVVGSQQTPLDAAILLASLRTCEPPPVQYARSHRCTRAACYATAPHTPPCIVHCPLSHRAAYAPRAQATTGRRGLALPSGGTAARLPCAPSCGGRRRER